MKGLLFAVLGIAVFAGLLFVPAYADTSSSAVGEVQVIVNPNVAVSIPENPPEVNHQTGDVSVTLTFVVDANQQEVCLFAEASDLWKGDDPTNPDGVAPIPVDTDVPVVIQPLHANPIHSGTNKAAFIGAGTPIGEFPTLLTDTICFESSQNNRFSQPVDVTITWNQDDAEKPTGEYSGMVRLTALVVDAV